MKIVSAEFITSAVKPSQYAPSQGPEIAFAGRSNVGKSSLINTLVNRRRLVKTSATPGRTQLINFFWVNDTLSLVDLPGYGYARVPVAVKRQWGPMVETYLSQRRALKGVTLIMDIRRQPGAEEFQLRDWLSRYQIPDLLVLTKCDKLSKNKQQIRRRAVAQGFGVSSEDLILFSAKTRLGREAVWQAINRLIGETPLICR